MAKVSIYMVYKNYPKRWLTCAINGALAQTCTDYEIVLVDYGSDIDHLDNVLYYLEDKRIRLYRLIGENSFISAVQFAVSKCQGEYILRADCDDILFPHALERMSNVLEATGRDGVIPGNIDIDKDNKPGKINGPGKRMLPSQSLIKKNKYDYVRFGADQKYRDGTSMMTTFNKYGFNIATIQEPLFYYRVHDKSITHGKYSTEEIKKVDKKIIEGGL